MASRHSNILWLEKTKQKRMPSFIITINILHFYGALSKFGNSNQKRLTKMTVNVTVETVELHTIDVNMKFAVVKQI